MAQIVSHYQTRTINEFLNECERLGVKIPGIFGVFYYRSANLRTLETLSKFFPVPIEELKRDFQADYLPDEICALSIQALLQRGVKNVYVSNLPLASATTILSQIEARVERMLEKEATVQKPESRSQNGL